MASVLLPVIKPELADEFVMIWDTWFVLEDTVEDEKFPGKLKSKLFCLCIERNLSFFLAEWETRSGTFVALGNKMYQGYDEATESTKKSTKGIPHVNKFEMDTWLSVLLDESFPQQSVQINSLRLNRNKEMSRMCCNRSALSDLFLKMQVQADKVTCTPLMQNNEYL